MKKNIFRASLFILLTVFLVSDCMAFGRSCNDCSSCDHFSEYDDAECDAMQCPKITKSCTTISCGDRLRLSLAPLQKYDTHCFWELYSNNFNTSEIVKFKRTTYDKINAWYAHTHFHFQTLTPGEVQLIFMLVDMNGCVQEEVIYTVYVV